jgi:hypothetical protein
VLLAQRQTDILARAEALTKKLAAFGAHAPVDVQTVPKITTTYKVGVVLV